MSDMEQVSAQPRDTTDRVHIASPPHPMSDWQCVCSSQPLHVEQGVGLSYDAAGDSYDGEWQNGLRHGKGRATYGGREVDGFGGDEYEGEWQRGLR